MIDFQWPWAFALAPLPFLVWRLWRPAPPLAGAALRVPAVADFLDAQAGTSSRARARGLWLAALAWLALVAATARPMWEGPMTELPVSGRDLMLAVDISGSMQIRDFDLRGRRVDRLTATKAVAAQFIERRKGDRLGLILFGRQAYLQAPLTFDTSTVARLLDEAQIGFAGQETAIGDAIGLALKRARANPQSRSVLILLTDGANTAGVIDPLKAAQLAGAGGLRVYTIGIGGRGDGSLFDLIPRGSDLDEPTLREIAAVTGGQYFRAHDASELARIYDVLDELEPLEQELAGFRPRRALYMWPLGFALLLGVVLAWRVNGAGGLRLRAAQT
jgi:Ca-activated chloride channel family protein